MNFYAGFGPRDTPPDVTAFVKMLAHAHRGADIWLRSGHSGNFDLACECGAYTQAHIFLPWPDFEARGEDGEQTEPVYGAVVYQEPSIPAFKMAQAFHPRWDRCGDKARKLLARNCHVILGVGLNEPAVHALTWTRDGSVDGLGKPGGTAHALRLCAFHGVKVYNLAIEAHVVEIDDLMWKANGPIGP